MLKWLKKWGAWLALAVLVGLGAVAKLFRSKEKPRSNDDVEDLQDQNTAHVQKEIDDIEAEVKDTMNSINEAEQAGKDKQEAIDKEDYSDAKSAVDSFNKP